MDDTLKQVGKWVAAAGVICFSILRMIRLPKLEWVGFVLTGIALVLLACGEIIRYRENSKLPVRTVNATFVSQSKRRRRRRICAYYMTFQPADNGPRLEFEVPFTEYDSYDPGTTGVLTYQGWHFISFRRGAVPAAAPISMTVSEPIVMLETAPEAPQQPNGILTHELDE